MHRGLLIFRFEMVKMSCLDQKRMSMGYYYHFHIPLFANLMITIPVEYKINTETVNEMNGKSKPNSVSELSH